MLQWILNIGSILGLIQTIFWIINGIRSLFKSPPKFLAKFKNIKFRRIVTILIQIFPLIVFVVLLFLDSLSTIVNKWSIIRLSIVISSFVCYIFYLVIYYQLERIKSELEQQKKDIEKADHNALAYAIMFGG